jgi:hypothetical protein
VSRCRADYVSRCLSDQIRMHSWCARSGRETADTLTRSREQDVGLVVPSLGDLDYIMHVSLTDEKESLYIS